MEEPCGFAKCLVRWITGVICLLQISLKLSFLQPARLAPHLAAGLRSWSALGPRCLPSAQHRGDAVAVAGSWDLVPSSLRAKGAQLCTITAHAVLSTLISSLSRRSEQGCAELESC